MSQQQKSESEIYELLLQLRQEINEKEVSARVEQQQSLKEYLAVRGAQSVAEQKERLKRALADPRLRPNYSSLVDAHLSAHSREIQIFTEDSQSRVAVSQLSPIALERIVTLERLISQQKEVIQHQARKLQRRHQIMENIRETLLHEVIVLKNQLLAKRGVAPEHDVSTFSMFNMIDILESNEEAEIQMVKMKEQFAKQAVVSDALHDAAIHDMEDRYLQELMLLREAKKESEARIQEMANSEVMALRKRIAELKEMITNSAREKREMEGHLSFNANRVELLEQQLRDNTPQSADGSSVVLEMVTQSFASQKKPKRQRRKSARRESTADAAKELLSNFAARKDSISSSGVLCEVESGEPDKVKSKEDPTLKEEESVSHVSFQERTSYDDKAEETPSSSPSRRVSFVPSHKRRQSRQNKMTQCGAVESKLVDVDVQADLLQHASVEVQATVDLVDVGVDVEKGHTEDKDAECHFACMDCILLRQQLKRLEVRVLSRTAACQTDTEVLQAEAADRTSNENEVQLAGPTLQRVLPSPQLDSMTSDGQGSPRLLTEIVSRSAVVCVSYFLRNDDVLRYAQEFSACMLRHSEAEQFLIASFCREEDACRFVLHLIQDAIAGAIGLHLNVSPSERHITGTLWLHQIALRFASTQKRPVLCAFGPPTDWNFDHKLLAGTFIPPLCCCSTDFVLSVRISLELTLLVELQAPSSNDYLIRGLACNKLMKHSSVAKRFSVLLLGDVSHLLANISVNDVMYQVQNFVVFVFSTVDDAMIMMVKALCSAHHGLYITGMGCCFSSTFYDKNLTFFGDVELSPILSSDQKLLRKVSDFFATSKSDDFVIIPREWEVKRRVHEVGATQGSIYRSYYDAIPDFDQLHIVHRRSLPEDGVKSNRQFDMMMVIPAPYQNFSTRIQIPSVTLPLNTMFVGCTSDHCFTLLSVLNQIVNLVLGAPASILRVAVAVDQWEICVTASNSVEKLLKVGALFHLFSSFCDPECAVVCVLMDKCFLSLQMLTVDSDSLPALRGSLVESMQRLAAATPSSCINVHAVDVQPLLANVAGMLQTEECRDVLVQLQCHFHQQFVVPNWQLAVSSSSGTEQLFIHFSTNSQPQYCPFIPTDVSSECLSLEDCVGQPMYFVACCVHQLSPLEFMHEIQKTNGFSMDTFSSDSCLLAFKTSGEAVSFLENVCPGQAVVTFTSLFVPYVNTSSELVVSCAAANRALVLLAACPIGSILADEAVVFQRKCMRSTTVNMFCTLISQQLHLRLYSDEKDEKDDKVTERQFTGKHLSLCVQCNCNYLCPKSPLRCNRIHVVVFPMPLSGDTNFLLYLMRSAKDHGLVLLESNSGKVGNFLSLVFASCYANDDAFCMWKKHCGADPAQSFSFFCKALRFIGDYTSGFGIDFPIEKLCMETAENSATDGLILSYQLQLCGKKHLLPCAVTPHFVGRVWVYCVYAKDFPRASKMDQDTFVTICHTVSNRFSCVVLDDVTDSNVGIFYFVSKDGRQAVNCCNQLMDELLGAPWSPQLLSSRFGAVERKDAALFGSRGAIPGFAPTAAVNSRGLRASCSMFSFETHFSFSENRQIGMRNAKRAAANLASRTPPRAISLLEEHVVYIKNTSFDKLRQKPLGVLPVSLAFFGEDKRSGVNVVGYFQLDNQTAGGLLLAEARIPPLESLQPDIPDSMCYELLVGVRVTDDMTCVFEWQLDDLTMQNGCRTIWAANQKSFRLIAIRNVSTMTSFLAALMQHNAPSSIVLFRFQNQQYKDPFSGIPAASIAHWMTFLPNATWIVDPGALASIDAEMVNAAKYSCTVEVEKVLFHTQWPPLAELNDEKKLLNFLKPVCSNVLSSSLEEEKVVILISVPNCVNTMIEKECGRFLHCSATSEHATLYFLIVPLPFDWYNNIALKMIEIPSVTCCVGYGQSSDVWIGARDTLLFQSALRDIFHVISAASNDKLWIGPIAAELLSSEERSLLQEPTAVGLSTEKKDQRCVVQPIISMAMLHSCLDNATAANIPLQIPSDVLQVHLVFNGLPPDSIHHVIKEISDSLGLLMMDHGPFEILWILPSIVSLKAFSSVFFAFLLRKVSADLGILCVIQRVTSGQVFWASRDVHRRSLEAPNEGIFLLLGVGIEQLDLPMLQHCDDQEVSGFSLYTLGQQDKIPSTTSLLPCRKGMEIFPYVVALNCRDSTAFCVGTMIHNIFFATQFLSDFCSFTLSFFPPCSVEINLTSWTAVQLLASHLTDAYAVKICVTKCTDGFSVSTANQEVQVGEDIVKSKHEANADVVAATDESMQSVLPALESGTVKDIAHIFCVETKVESNNNNHGEIGTPKLQNDTTVCVSTSAGSAGAVKFDERVGDIDGSSEAQRSCNQQLTPTNSETKNEDTNQQTRTELKSQQASDTIMQSGGLNTSLPVTSVPDSNPGSDTTTYERYQNVKNVVTTDETMKLKCEPTSNVVLLESESAPSVQRSESTHQCRELAEKATTSPVPVISCGTPTEEASCHANEIDVDSEVKHDGFSSTQPEVSQKLNNVSKVEGAALPSTNSQLRQIVSSPQGAGVVELDGSVAGVNSNNETPNRKTIQKTICSTAKRDEGGIPLHLQQFVRPRQKAGEGNHHGTGQRFLEDIVEEWGSQSLQEELRHLHTPQLQRLLVPTRPSTGKLNKTAASQSRFKSSEHDSFQLTPRAACSSQGHKLELPCQSPHVQVLCCDSHKAESSEIQYSATASGQKCLHSRQHPIRQPALSSEFDVSITVQRVEIKGRKV